MDNLWPTDIVADGESTSALKILKEQASNLGNMTKNIVKAEVRSRKDLNEKMGSKVYFDFNIKAPLLQNYRYRLFQVSFDIGHLYPIEVFLEDDMARELGRKFEEESGKLPVSVSSDLEFIGLLKEIFGSRITRNIIKNLVDSSKEPDSESN